MRRSERLQNMFAHFAYDDICTFLRAFEIFYQVEWSGYIPSNSCIGFRHNGKSYEYSDVNTFHFYVHMNPRKSACEIIVFGNSEEEIINKFERFIKLKAFL